MTKALWAVLPGAGTGSRFGSDKPKQYADINGQPVVWHTINKLAQLPLAGIVLVVAADDAYVNAIDFTDCLKGKSLHIVAGGASRCDSVLAGVEALTQAQANDFVLVHDVARPCVLVSDIHKLIDAVTVSGSVGGALASPVRDTLKHGVEVDGYQHIDHTVDRAGLWQIFTPQLFTAAALIEALRQSSSAVTDECGAMEAMGHQPLLVNSSANNIKITYREDLALAEFLIQRNL